MARQRPCRLRGLAVGLLCLLLALVLVAGASASSSATATATATATGESTIGSSVDQDADARLAQATDAAKADSTTTSSSTTTTTSSTKAHKPLLPLDTRDWITFALGGVGLIIAAAGGIGGGGILVPLYFLVGGFDPKAAVALSNMTIVGASISNVAIAASRRHPGVDKPLIDWSLIMVMEPPVIAGAVVGSLINKLLPSLVIAIFLVLTMGYMARRTLTKGLKIWKQEGGWAGVFGHGHTLGDGGHDGGGHHHLPSHQHQQQGGAGETRGLLAAGQKQQQQHQGGLRYGSEAPTIAELDEDAVRRIQEKERHVALWQPLLLGLCFSGMAVLQVLKGAFACGSLAYWLFVFAVLPWVVPFFLLGRGHVLREHRKKVIFGYPFHRGDVHWDERNSLRYPMICSLAGLASGLFGIGGGMVKAPLLLDMGVLPIVQAATVATMILFTSSASAVSFIMLDVMPRDYALAYFFFGMAATGVGAAAVKQVLMKHHKQSIVVLSVAAVLCTSVVTMGINSAIRLSEDPGSILKVGSLCGPGTGE